MSNKLIELKNLTKNFDDQQVLRGINLDIHENEFLTLLGPSGCGKTTTLRIIAGFEEPSGGEVLFNGIEISKLPPYKREINTVFQKYALFPHLNVMDNIGFGLNLKKVDKLLEVTDLVMLDIKHINPQEHLKLCKQPNDNILAFAKYLDKKGIQMWIRHVVVPHITLNKEYLYELGLFIGKLKMVKALDILPYHDMAKPKYEKLGMDYPLKDIEPATKEMAVAARKIVLQGFKESRIKLLQENK